MVTPQRLTKILVALWLTIATFKIAWFPIRPGLDPSWLYGINYFADVPQAFGRDMAFTWGPLGYLLSALPIGEHVIAAMITAVVISGLFAMALFHWAWHSTKVWQFILFAGVFQLEACWPYLPERLLTLTLILWAAIALEPGYASALLIVAFIAGVSIFVKWNVGLAAISILFAGGAYVIYRDKRRGALWAVAAVGVFAVLASVLASVLFADAAAVARWLRISANLTSGYSEAMSLMPATGLESGTPQLLALFALAAGVLAYKRSSRAIFLGVISFTLFMFIKHGFVRHDTPHIASFATAFIGVVAVLLLSSRKTFEVRLCVGVLLAMVAVQLTLLPRKDIGRDRIVKKLVGVQGVEALADIVQPAQTKQRLLAATQTQLAGHHLPDTWLASIAQHGNSLMPLPSELSFCAANRITCKPLAVLQVYSAYTSALDTWSAERVAAADAPGAVLLGYDAIDDRHMFFDAPALWREIINRYEVNQNAPAFMLLTRRAEPADGTLRDLGTQQTHFGEWVAVAPTLNLTYARLHVGLSALGHLARFAWGVPPLGIHLVFEDGSAMAYHLIRDVAQDGLLINFVPRNLREVYDLMASQSAHRVVQFRVVSAPDDQKYFANDMKVEWLQSPQKIFLQRNSIDRDLSQATLPSAQPPARTL